jgi:predicted metal-dependent HD superfamily phosphohydrolase
MSETAEEDVHRRWLSIASSSSFELSQEAAEEIWHEHIHKRYSEPHRHYHTLTHIQTMLRLSSQYSSLITDKTAVDLSIVFHDIIYDPKSASNEEDSALLFESLFSSSSSSSSSKSDLMKKVSQYINETKRHSVSSSTDEDLKLFIDIDLHILSTDRVSWVDAM